MVVLYAGTGKQDVVTFVLLVAFSILSYGWAELVGVPGRKTIGLSVALVGVCALVVTRLSGTFAWGAVAAVFAIAVSAVGQMVRKPAREHLTDSLAASVCGGIFTAVGTVWLSAASSPDWQPVLTSAALILVTCVVGNQWGTSVRSNLIGSVVCGAVSGLILGGVTVAMSLHSRVVQMMMPSISSGILSALTTLTLTMLLGIGIGLVVAAIDIVFGEHGRRCNETGALARGALKFVASGMPVYVLLRIGGM
ncbi:hypothetical protein [Gleimia hominis]|uniref:hypothetical protein n=1 Tax=Gleimia hominis TaxID=595468 RepID=UPI000C80680B|nr:hypothetical protein [Gleimia hominis]WIK64480.1 hypothetical protein CJ187_009310 [Gleimia hominis]